MMHVLFYTDTPNLGGAEKHMLLLAKYLEKLGVKVSLAYGKYSEMKQMHDSFEEVCKKVYILPTLHKHDPRHYLSLRKILEQNSFDLIHLHLWNPGSARYAFFAASQKGIPIVTTEHDPFELSGFKKWIKKMGLKRTAKTITVSQDNLRLLNEYYGYPKNKLELLPNGIELDRFLDNSDPLNPSVGNRKLNDVFLQEGAHVITCIAELHPRKGHKYLLEAFKKLQTHMPQVELLLVGKGPIENELKAEYGGLKNIHFLGWREDIPEILKESDILVLPSLKEAFGQVIVEAMASGVAVIATDNGGPADIIQDGLTGYLVPPGSSDAIYEKLILLLSNPAQKKDMEKAARQRAKEHFSAERMAQQTLELYQKTLEEKS